MTADASIVFIGHRSLTYYPPGENVYHLPAGRYRMRTYCGILIWDEVHKSPLVLLRRDTASRIASLCQRCGAREATP